jgi:hypothetical protein
MHGSGCLCGICKKRTDGKFWQSMSRDGPFPANHAVLWFLAGSDATILTIAFGVVEMVISAAKVVTHGSTASLQLMFVHSGFFQCDASLRLLHFCWQASCP